MDGSRVRAVSCTSVDSALAHVRLRSKPLSPKPIRTCFSTSDGTLAQLQEAPLSLCLLPPTRHFHTSPHPRPSLHCIPPVNCPHCGSVRLWLPSRRRCIPPSIYHHIRNLRRTHKQAQTYLCPLTCPASRSNLLLHLALETSGFRAQQGRDQRPCLSFLAHCLYRRLYLSSLRH